MPNFKHATLLWLCALLLPFVVSAQSDKLSIAKQFLQSKEVTALRLSQEDVSDPAVRQTYSKQSGVSNFYFQQRYHGIDVMNAVLNVHITKDDQILTYGSRFLTGLSGRINTTSPVLKPLDAILMAVQELGYTSYRGTPVLKEDKGGDAREAVYEDSKLSSSGIPVKLIYQPLADGSVKLCWQVTIDEPEGKHWWVARIDAQTGKLLDKNDLIISCYFGESDAEHAAHTSGKARTGMTVYNSIRNAGKTAVELPIEGDDFTPPPGSSYRVYAPPVESPNYGNRTLVSDPADLTASPFGWHDTDGVDGAEFTITRGNNVYAQIDNDNNNSTFGFAPDGGASLAFDFPIDFAQAPSTYQSAAVTNLFYWNNYMHDFAYRYGFDEVSGNFQTNNYGNGGVGNDFVIADAQDAGGLNNANFGTPDDGASPRMQMYLWNHTSPFRDGDIDNGVIAHEYTHGISNRLTGGPGNSGCLGNQEQMGEGWSDWFALMASLEPGDTGADSRGIGTYVLGQAPNGVGIRPTPYSTNMAINPVTYNTIKTSAVPHGVGYVWCGMIWDLTWALIDAHGMNSGYEKAMFLITEGMKLQPCSPGFVDGRNAILAADQALYGGENECLIWQVFARRGLGYSASQGSSGSVSDGVEAFDLSPFCFINVSPVTDTVCSTSNTAVFQVTVGQNLMGSFNLSVTSAPAGSTQQFSQTTISNGDVSTLTIGNLSSVVQGTYSVTVSGTNGTSTYETTVILVVKNPIIGAPVLVSPADASTTANLSPALSWNALTNAETYELQLATDNAFSNIVYSNSGITGTSINLTLLLTGDTQYFWRVRGSNLCGIGDYANAFSFFTPCMTCTSNASTDVPVTISPNGTPTITSTLYVPQIISITDVNVINLDVTHTYIDDLNIDLISPQGTTVRLMNKPCNSEHNILINFDDQAASGSFPCPPTNNGTYKPFQALSAFNGQLSQGTWILKIYDTAAEDGGSLNHWGLSICGPNTYFRDADNDGYGNIADYTTGGCTPPSGYVADNTDCNDENGNINPGRQEQCNGIDDNCNDQIDEGVVAVTLSVVAADISCFGLTDGSIDLTVNTSSAPPAFLWNNNAITEDISGLSAGTYSVTVTGADGCTGTASGTINEPTMLTVTETHTNATCPNPDGSIDITPSGGSPEFSYLWNDNVMTEDRNGIFSGNYTVTVTDGHGCSTSTSVSIGGSDQIPPEITCQNINVSLNSSGNVGITPANVFGGGSENCSNITLQSVSPASFNCQNIGMNTVTLVASDADGNTSTCTATVTVQDLAPPTASCQNVTVNLNASGAGSITAAQVNNGSLDACSAVMLGVNPNTFGCANVGPNTVVLTVTDSHANTSTCSATVTVRDLIAPTASCQNVTVDLNASGAGSVSAAQVNNGSSDACGAVMLGVSPGTFGCANVGPNTVVLTVTDSHANTSTCSATATVRDLVAPTASCQNVTVNLNSSGAGSVTASQVNNGSSDACGSVTLSVSPNTFGCGNVGSNTVVLTVTDTHNNTGTCSATVVVQDNAAPTAGCQNITIDLNAAGAVSVTAAQVNSGSTDACGSVSLSVTPNTFGCANVGPNTVVLTVTDSHNNTSTCSASVTVRDVTPPTAVCQNITVNLNASGAASITAAQVNNGSSDACGAVTLSVNPGAFGCANAGANAVVLTVTDSHNNTSTCAATVTVVDNIPPVFTFVPAGLTVECGQASLFGTPTANDNCSVSIAFSDNTSPNCAGGVRVRTWTATDPSGNTATASQTITLKDSSPPMLTGIPDRIAIACDEPIPAPASPTATDNCDASVEIVLSETSTQTNDGSPTDNNYVITRTWTASDNCGNTASGIQEITVQDLTPPTIVFAEEKLKDLVSGDTLQVECSSGFYLNENAVSVIDNCDASVSIAFEEELTDYNACSYILHDVWFATDNAGNVSKTDLYLLFTDTQSPVIFDMPADTAINCGDLIPLPVAPLTGDNCATPFLTMVDIPEPNSCSILRTWTSTDYCGNTAVATQKISIIDDLPPFFPNGNPDPIAVSCRSQIPTLNPVAVDNCTSNVPITLTEQIIPGTPFNTLLRTWTAVDKCGQTASVVQSVLVKDSIAPVFTSVLPADLCGSQSMTYDQFNAYVPPVLTASDNCGPVTVTGPVITNDGNCDKRRFFLTWTASDDMGHSVSFTQSICIRNSRPKALINLPFNLQCGLQNHISVFAKFGQAPYTFQWEQVSGNWTVLGSTTHQLLQLIPEFTQATFSVTVTDSYGCTGTAIQTVKCLNSLEGQSGDEVIQTQPDKDSGFTAANDISLFPNPANNYVLLGLAHYLGEAISVKVLDQLGQIVFSQNIAELGDSQLELRLDNFPSGIYLVWVDNGRGKKVVKKLIRY